MANNNDVSITYDAVLEIAQRIDDSRIGFSDMQEQLDRLVDGLSGKWKGAAQKEFSAAYEKLRPKLKVINSTLEKYSQLIRAYVQRQQEQDAESAKSSANTAFVINDFVDNRSDGNVNISESKNDQQVSDGAKYGVSNQVEIDESLYNQNLYNNEFYTTWDDHGVEKSGNGGCALTAAAYALSRMGISVDPLTAKERSGGVSASWSKIPDGAAIEKTWQYGDIDKFAIEFKNNPNMSPLIIKMKSITHYVVLKDIILDSSGNIEKYVIFDPGNGGTKEYDSFTDYEYVHYYIRK